MKDRTVRIRYDIENGIAVPDAKAEATVLRIHKTIASYHEFLTSTENVILAARVLRKEGKIPALVLYYKDFEMIVDNDGRITNWPAGFCDHFDKWLERLI